MVTQSPEPEPEPELEHWEDAAAAAKAARMAQLTAQLDSIRSGEVDPEAYAETIKAAEKAKLESIRSGETGPVVDAEVVKDAQHAQLAATRDEQEGRAALAPLPARPARSTSVQEEPAPIRTKKIFVRGVAERFENQDVLIATFSKFGRCDPEHPPRIRHKDNDNSWAVVTMESEEAAEAVMAAASEVPSPLTVSRYSEKTAKQSTGGMFSMRSLAGIDSSQMTEELIEALDKLRRQGQDVEERPVVDWTSEPKMEIARRYRLLHQAVYVNTTDISGREERYPVQRGLQPKDENGWLKTDGVRKYPVCDTSPEDLGQIGGTGLRVYFLLLKSLSIVLLACGVISLPAMVSYRAQEMYDQPEAELYAHLAGPARLGLGNIRVSDADIAAGESGTLWLSSVTNALVSIVLTVFTLWIGKNVKAVSDTVDLESVTMADYTVLIKPANDEVWEGFRAGSIVSREKQKAALQQLVKQTLETAIPGSAIANIGGEPAVWIAWNEEESFRLWEDKRALLLELEAALKARRVLGEASGTDAVRQLQVKLKRLNARLDSLSPRRHEDGVQVTPVAVFATFENDKSFEEALKIKQLRLHDGLTVSIQGAPEPETILWKNLQYTQKQRRIRAATIISCTVAVLLLGVWLIVLVGKLKDRNSYTNGCKWVVGPQTNATAGAICPGALDADTAYPEVYHDSYQSLADALATTEFPRIATFELGPARLPRGAICQPARSAGRVSWPDWTVTSNGERSANCHRVDSKPAALFIGGDVDAMCYACICALESVRKDRDASLGQDYCKKYEDDKASAVLWFLVGTLVVVLLNQALKFAVIFTSPFAKAHTISLQMMATSTRIFLCQFINYIVLIFLLNSSILLFNDIPGEKFDNINSKWYAVVAAPMLESLLLQFCLVPCEHVFFASGLLEFVTRTVSGASTQNLLNQALAPIERDIAVGYGEILLALAVTLVYGPALPLLYFVGAAGFAMRYWVEKWADLTVYKRPPLLDGNLFWSFDQLLMMLVVVQAMLATHFISAAGGLHPEVPRKHDTFKPHVFPMFFTFLFVCIAFFTKIATKASRRFHRRVLSLPCGKYCLHDGDHVADENLPPFSEAYSKGLVINEDDDFFADELEDLLDLSLVFADELVERADIDGDPQLYNELRAIILTHAHDTNVDEGDASHQQPKVSARKKSAGHNGIADPSSVWRP